MNNKNQIPETGFLRLSTIIGSPKKPGIPAIIPVSRSTWYEGIKSGRFPQPIRLSERTVGYRAADIRALLTSLEKGAE